LTGPAAGVVGEVELDVVGEEHPTRWWPRAAPLGLFHDRSQRSRGLPCATEAITMTTAELQRTRVPPSLYARWVFGGVVVAHLTEVEAIFIVGGAGANTLLTIGNFLGLHVATIMIVQLTLIARLPWLDRRIGMDRLTVWHRWLGLTLFWVVLLHATFVVLGFAQLDRRSPLRTFVSLAGQPQTLLGMTAAAILIAVVVISPGMSGAACSTRPGMPFTSACTSPSRSASSTSRWNRAPSSCPPWRPPTGTPSGPWSSWLSSSAGS